MKTTSEKYSHCKEFYDNLSLTKNAFFDNMSPNTYSGIIHKICNVFAYGKHANLMVKGVDDMETKGRKASAGSQSKSTGIVRKVDELGRIVLPVELRRTLEINEKDDVEIYVDGSSIILKKYRPTCVFCNGVKSIIKFKGKNICPRCLKGLKNLEIT